MTPFLKQVALHYYNSSDISKICFVMPNRRATVFFKHYLQLEVAAKGKPLIAPGMLSMSEFVYELSGLRKTSKISLLLKLYRIYSRLFKQSTGKDPEPLDDFIFWGDVLLSDFNDVDKYLASPGRIFTNVSQYKEMLNPEEYLTQTQLDALSRFMSNFRESDGKGIKKQFLQIWDLLAPLYDEFNECLSGEGLCYEGMAYRKAASMESLPENDDIEKYVFVGLNALSESEKAILSRLHKAGLAEFVWDYSSELIKDPSNKSSFFLRENVARFPQAFELDPQGLPHTEFNVLSVPSSFGQAKQLKTIFGRLGSVGMDTAVILPDENMLLPVLNSIPSEISDINVTMGYPMTGSEFWSLMSELSRIHLNSRIKDGKRYYYNKHLRSVFSNSVFKAAVEGNESIKKIVSEINSSSRYYIAEEELLSDPYLETLFGNCIQDPLSDSPEQIRNIEQSQLKAIHRTALAIKDNPDMGLELDFAMDYYSSISSLSELELSIRPSTYFRAFESLTNLDRDSQPFRGEPLKGLQIMGPLEVRALDFRNLVILGANEGLFPRKSVSSSFIPAELRKGFGLPTYEFQDAIWAYYFYRMIQRCENVWMVYDSRTEISRSGEESRYIKQLEMLYGVNLNRFVAVPQVSLENASPCIAKTPEHVRIIRESRLSASSLQNYLHCPAKFFYHTVEKLYSEDELRESLDAGEFGNVFHDSMKELYQGKKVITRDYLEELLGSEDRIKEIVSSKICEQLHTFEVSGKNLIHRDIVCQYVMMVLKRDLEQMDQYKVNSFTILRLEKKEEFEVDGLHFTGTIDRLDSFIPSEVRVVDYKTGKVSDMERDINDSNASKVVDALFGPKNSGRPKIALQLYLYDLIAAGMKECEGARLLNCIYQPSSLFKEAPLCAPLSPLFAQKMKERLSALLREMTDISVPFRRCENEEDCQYCDYKGICGR